MKVINNLDLTAYNSYRVKSIARKAYFPENTQEVVNLFNENPERILLGGGYNIILSKPVYEQDIVILNGNVAHVDINSNKITAEAGISMKKLSELAHENSLTGLELFYDIPSSLGGAIVMNAGSKGEDMQFLLDSVTYFDCSEKAVINKNVEEMKWGYRYSEFLNDRTKIILEATLHLKKGAKDEIHQKMMDNLKARQSKQPKSYPNAGSVFKRPEGYFVGKIMDDLDLKGTAVGGAKVSEKHGGFIVNFNNATGEDIINLIKKIQKVTYEKLNVVLEVEQRII